MPEDSTGERGYRIRETERGTQRAVGESEIRPADADRISRSH
jgi:hypothetical protein